MLPGGNKRIENCPWAIQSMCGNSSVHCRCFDCVTKLGMHMLQTKRAHTQSYSHLFYPHFFVCECKCMSIGQQQIIVVIWTADASPQILSKHRCDTDSLLAPNEALFFPQPFCFAIMYFQLETGCMHTQNMFLAKNLSNLLALLVFTVKFSAKTFAVDCSILLNGA